MARSARLLRLLHAMRTMAPPLTAARLAEETGVSPRSLYRDIDALRAAGARIEGERGYGYRLVEDPALPPQTLDLAEIEALALGLAEVRAIGDPALATAAVSVLAKIGAILPDERERQLVHAIADIFRPEPRYGAMIDLAPLREACWHEGALQIGYCDGEHARTDRVILPLSLIYNDDCVTVLAWCCLRQDFRMFRADRIADVRPGGFSFRPRRVALLRDYIQRLQAARTARNALEPRASGVASMGKERRMADTEPLVSRRNPESLLDSTGIGLSQISIAEAGKLAFVSGQTATPRDRGDIPPDLATQARVVAANLAAALRELAATPQDIALMRVYVVDATTARFEEAWTPICDMLDGALPSMTGIGVQALWTPMLQLEVEMTVRVR